MMLCIVGPTASGKTKLATHLAHLIGSELISADSRQVYRGMDLGTGKDLQDYQVLGNQIPYHLIDIVDAGSKYNLFQYQRDCHKALDIVSNKGITNPILCGGTGLYAECILGGYQLPEVPENPTLRQKLSSYSLPQLLDKLHSYGSKHNNGSIDSIQRAVRAIEIAEYRQHIQKQEELATYPSVPAHIFCLDLPRHIRRERISSRLKQRLEVGMIEEVEALLSSGILAEDLIYYGLEYKWLTLYVLGQIDYQTMYTHLEVAIHQFAKRQMTWFRGMERRGYKLNYIDALAPLEQQIQQVLNHIR